MRLLWIAAAGALLACSDSSAPDAAFEGTYTLQTVNGRQLPYRLENTPASRVDLTASELRLDSGGAFRQIDNVVAIQNAGVALQYSDTVDGAWTRSGRTVHIIVTGTINSITLPFSWRTDGSLVLDISGMSAVYRKE